jgi:hypothetical protein
MLHVKPGPTTVVVAGPAASLLAAEALRWRDTVKILTATALPEVKDKRVEIYKELPKLCAEVVLLSPDQAPEPWMPALKPGGVIQVSTYDEKLISSLRAKIRDLTGSAVPWREYTPAVLWGVIGCLGSSPRRVRRPPEGTRRITERFLPSVFSFGKDEIQLVFGKEQP